MQRSVYDFLGKVSKIQQTAVILVSMITVLKLEKFKDFTLTFFFEVEFFINIKSTAKYDL